MRKKLSFLTFVCLLVWNLPAFAQTVDEIVNKNIEARGGLEKLKALKTMKFMGKMTLPMQQGLEGPIMVYSKRPNFIRVEFTLQGNDRHSSIRRSECMDDHAFYGIEGSSKNVRR